MTKGQKSKEHFTEEDIQGLVALGEVLMKIRKRLIAEGKIEDKRITPPPEL